MICENCGKNPARKFVRKSGGREITVELCPACYRALYPEQETDLLTAFLDRAAPEDKACPACGTTMSEFRRTGLLGCAYCYSAFRAELSETVRGMQGMQGEVRHTGKRPAAEAEEKYDRARDYAARREGLKERLEQAMRIGDYAEARRLRNELKALSVNPREGI